jgi:alkylated DNA nucleotide flippase Atl1
MIEKIDRRLQIKDQDVYELVLVIPPGKVSTYGDIANALGHPQAARLIGNIQEKSKSNSCTMSQNCQIKWQVRRLYLWNAIEKGIA